MQINIIDSSYTFANQKIIRHSCSIKWENGMLWGHGDTPKKAYQQADRQLRSRSHRFAFAGITTCTWLRPADDTHSVIFLNSRQYIVPNKHMDISKDGIPYLHGRCYKY